jgi:hypothetical protein
MRSIEKLTATTKKLTEGDSYASPQAVKKGVDRKQGAPISNEIGAPCCFVGSTFRSGLKSHNLAAVIPSKARNLSGTAALAERFFVATLLRMTLFKQALMSGWMFPHYIQYASYVY